MTNRLCNHEHFTQGCRHCDPLSYCQAQLAAETKRRIAAEDYIEADRVYQQGAIDHVTNKQRLSQRAKTLVDWQALVPADEKEKETT